MRVGENQWTLWSRRFLFASFFLFYSGSIIASFYLGENNTHATLKTVETLQFPGWPESGKMSLAVIGLNFFTDNDERSLVVKVWSMSCSPDSLEATVSGIYNVRSMTKNTHCRGGSSLACIFFSNTASRMNGWRAKEACPRLPGTGLQEPQLAPCFLKSALFRGGRWSANLLNGSHEGEVLYQSPTQWLWALQRVMPVALATQLSWIPTSCSPLAGPMTKAAELWCLLPSLENRVVWLHLRCWEEDIGNLEPTVLSASALPSP